MSWFGFWIFMAVFCWCEYKLYSNGHNTFLWKYKTAAEFEIQKNIIHRNRGDK